MITQTSDIGLFSYGNGGDMAIIGDDLNTSETLYQVIYISLFGGNIEASTIGNELSTDERFDFWGNELFFSDKKEKQFNSETQRTLNEVVLNSDGRLKIKQSVENDLFFLKNIVNFEVNVYINSSVRVSIEIKLTDLANRISKLYQLTWDNAKKEVIIDNTI